MEILTNQEALNRALNIYRTNMRSFIISKLRMIPGMNVDDVIMNSLDTANQSERADEIEQLLKNSDRDINSIIDINDFPHLIHVNWRESFKDPLSDDKTFRNQLWIIKDGRNESWAHPPEGDIDMERTRAFLFLIADIMDKIKKPDVKSDIEKIRDEISSNNAAKQISEITEKLETEEKEKKKYKKELEKIEKRIKDTENQHKKDKKYLENIENQLEEVIFNKEKTEEELTIVKNDLKTAKDNLKEVEDAWLEVDKNLKGITADLQEVEKEKDSIQEQYELLYKQFEEMEIEIQGYKENLTSVENQLLEVKIEKSNTEEQFNTLLKPVYPPMKDDSDVHILDRRETDRKKYLINLLETKRPTIIYVHNSEKINQLLSFIGPEKVDSIGVHNYCTTADEENDLLTRLEHNELYAIVSDAIITSLPEQHTVEHIIVCHPVLCLDEFISRCKPAFSSKKITYIHLIYDSAQEFQNTIEELNHKYLEEQVLRKLFGESKKIIEANNYVIDTEILLNELDFKKTGIETGLLIFEELGLIEKNADTIKFPKSDDKRTLEDSYLYCEGKRLKEKINLESFQFGKESIDNIYEKISNNLSNEKNQIISEQEHQNSDIKNGNQNETDSNTTKENENTEMPYTPNHLQAIMTDEQINVIKLRSAAGEPLSMLSKEFGISSTAILSLVNLNSETDVE